MASRSPRRVALDVNAIIIMKKELGYSRLVRVVPMILKDLIPCAFEISPWLPRRGRVPFICIPISNNPGLVLHAVSPSFATVNNIQHIPFFVRFVVARVCYHDREL